MPKLSKLPTSLRSLIHLAGGTDTDQRLLAGQARLLFNHSPVGIGAALLVALLQTVVLWDTADRNQLILWISGVVLATLLRLGLVIAYRYSQPDESQVAVWVLRICAGNLLSGLIWGSSILLLDFSWPPQYQLFLMLALTSVTAGAISAYAVVYPAFLAIHLPALIPAIWWFMQQPDPAHQLLGVILLIYMTGLTVIGHTHYRAARRSLELGLENQQLVGELTDTNRQLGWEVEEKQHAMEALRDEKERAQVTLHSIGDGVITTDQNDEVLYLNAVAEQLTGWPLEEAAGCPVQKVFRLVECVDREQPVTERRVQGGHGLHEVIGKQQLIRRDGARFYINSCNSPIRSADGSALGSVTVFHDVTEQMKMAERLSYQACHDALTGLINRREFERFIELALKTARKNHSRHCLCYIDLDQFKVVNDTCGHVAGDELLRRLAGSLPSLLREFDIFARLGGDEFGMLLEECSAEDALEFAERIRVYVKEHRFIWDGKVFEIGASIGLVEISETSDSVASILSAADIACYAAKDMGRNQVHIYQGSDSESGRRHSEIQLVSEITRAVQTEKLVLYFQDIVPLGRGREYAPHGEVLVRMLSEQGELVSPALFFPAAERYDLMPSIDLWVIRNTLAWWSARCADRGVQSPGLISINLSGKSLGSESVQDSVLSLISEYQIVPGTICFEITETAAISGFELATRFIDSLQSCGMKIALDDFGGGLSSFAYLKNLSVDYLKIDGSFVRNIVDDPIDREMVKSIHQLGRVMGIQTIAECVDNDQTIAHLKDIGIDYAQGYGIAEPRPLKEC